MNSLYKDIAVRTGGEVYIGVVGPVRTGKSTFIKRFMDLMVVPGLPEGPAKERAVDELPQSAAGKTIMTTEPKFVPEDAAVVSVTDSLSARIRLIDCVGYVVPGAIGQTEGDHPRMVVSPWYDQPIAFDQAAEIGTRKVINDHSTVAVLVTTDGSISDLSREQYVDAERRVAEELKQTGKPFVILLNCLNPRSPESAVLAEQLASRYDVPVLRANCLAMSHKEMEHLLNLLTAEFPVREIVVELPRWVSTLPKNHWLRSSLFSTVRSVAEASSRMSDVEKNLPNADDCEYIDSIYAGLGDLGSGSAEMIVSIQPDLFYKVLGESTGLEISDEASLLPCVAELARIKKEYCRLKTALDEVMATGYGIVMPEIDELRLEEPEIIRQGGKYGVKLRASAPSIHMMAADIQTEVNPIVGSEKQSQELVSYLLKEFEDDPIKIWDSNIFGKSLNDLVNEGLQNKLYRMPQGARMKLRETLERLINDGCNGLVCIIL